MRLLVATVDSAVSFAANDGRLIALAFVAGSALTALGFAVARSLRSYLERRVREAVTDQSEELRQENRNLNRINRQLAHASFTDSLTGLWNRRFVETYVVPRLSVRPEPSESSFDPGGKHEIMLLMLDLDRLKTVNDRYGHPVGDTVILAAANALKQIFRRSDIIVRWGGDEFLVIAHRVNLQGARSLARRIATAFRSLELDAPGKPSPDVGCSIGFTFFPFEKSSPDGLGWYDCVAIADRALYVAKGQDRNAWAGIVRGDGPCPPELLSLIRHDLTGCLESGLVRLVTSTEREPELAPVLAQ